MCRGGAVRIEDISQDIAGVMALDLYPGHRRNCLAYAGVNHSEIVIYLRSSSNCRTGIAYVDSLFNGYCGRNALDEIDIRL